MVGSVSKSAAVVLAALAMAVGAPSEASAQVVAQATMIVPPIRHVEVVEVHADPDCGSGCQNVTLRVSANAEWALRIAVASSHLRVRTAALDPGIRNLEAADDAVMIEGSRGGEQIVILEVAGSEEPPVLNLAFLVP